MKAKLCVVPKGRRGCVAGWEQVMETSGSGEEGIEIAQ